MKSLYSFAPVLILSCLASSLFAQVTKTTIVEHFTNTSCSVCANNNAGYYNTINAHPNTIHISFHPSSPYTSDFFNQQNMAENDARTNFYGVYGATPRLVVNGTVISNSTLANTLNAQASAMSNYSFELTQSALSADSFEIRAIIVKVAADTLSNALLFLGVSEDTIAQSTNNGESMHYHVFRKTLTNINGNSIPLPSAVGDSFVLTLGYRAAATWQLDQLHSIGILQKNDKSVINSAKSENLVSTPISIIEPQTKYENILFPNPSSEQLFWKEKLVSIELYSISGAMLFQNKELGNSNSISILVLPKGIYFAKMTDISGNTYLQKIVKK